MVQKQQPHCLKLLMCMIVKLNNFKKLGYLLNLKG